MRHQRGVVIVGSFRSEGFAHPTKRLLFPPRPQQCPCRRRDDLEAEVAIHSAIQVAGGLRVPT